MPVNKDKLLELKLKRLSYAEIARQFNVSRQYIHIVLGKKTKIKNRCKRCRVLIKSWRTFCSRSCFLLLMKEESKNLVSNKQKLREQVLLREQYKCFVCKAENKKLVIHHIDGSGDLTNWEFSNNNLLNLVALCQSCHVKIHLGKLALAF